MLIDFVKILQNVSTYRIKPIVNFLGPKYSDPSRLKFVSLSINLKKVERNEKSHSSEALEPTNPCSTLKKRKTEVLTRLLLPPFTISLREKKQRSGTCQLHASHMLIYDNSNPCVLLLYFRDTFDTKKNSLRKS